MSDNIYIINPNLPLTDKVELINDMTVQLNGLVSQGKFDINELTQIYTDLNLNRKYKRNISLGNSLTDYGDWTHLKAEGGFSIWKITPDDYTYNALNKLYFDNKILDDRGEADSESATAFDFVYNYDAEASGGGGDYIDDTTEASTEQGTEFEVMDTTDDYLYLGEAATFSAAKFEWYTRGSYYALKIEYWNGAWTELTEDLNNLDDDTSNFESDGRISWTTPTDWTTTSVNGNTKYWIRISTTQTPVTVAKCYYLIPGDSVIAKLAMSSTQIQNEEWAWCTYGSTIYTTIRNIGNAAYEGNYYITSTSTTANKQNFFIYNHEYSADFEDSTYVINSVTNSPVISKGEISPPSGPSDGDRYLIITGETGSDWFGYDDDIAEYYESDTSWHFTTPTVGMLVYVTDESLYYVYSGSAWSALSSGGSETSISDADGDTKVETERTPDDDTIYLKSAGTDVGTITTAGLTVYGDADTVGGIIASRAKMGMPTSGVSDVAYFGHLDNFGDATSYALAQNNSGSTYLNSKSGQSISLMVAESTRLTISSADVVVNESGLDVNFRVEGDTNSNLFFVDAGNDWVSVGTSSGCSRLNILSDVAIYHSTTQRMQLYSLSEDNVFISFDSWWDGSNWKSKDAGSNFKMHKVGDAFHISFDSGIAVDANIPWHEVFTITTSELVINETGLDIDFRIESDTNGYAFFLQGSDGAIGMGTASPLTTSGGLDISSGSISLIVGADSGNSTRGATVTKVARIGCPSYTLAEEPTAILSIISSATENQLSIGGGTSSFNAATEIRFLTAGAVNTITGTERMNIASDGICTWTQNTDTFTLTGNGTDWYQKWDNGNLYLMTDEGTNTDTVVWASGKGTGYGYVGAETDGSHINFLAGATSGSILTSGALTIYSQPYANRGTITGAVALAVFGSTEIVMNDAGYDQDFRVETDTNANAFVIDAGAETATFGVSLIASSVLTIPNGAGGTTVDATGEICVDSTSRTLNYYDGTAEVVVQPIMSKSITVESPTSSEDISLFYIDDASTIVKIVAVLTGSGSQSVTWTVRHGTDRSATGAEVVTGGTTTTSLTTGSVVTSFNDATIVADSFVWLETTALGDTTDSLNITIYYRQDA